MILITPSQLAKQYFADGSRPPKGVILGWVEDGIIKGVKIGNITYIDQKSFELLLMHQNDAKNVKKNPFSSNPILDQLIIT